MSSLYAACGMQNYTNSTLNVYKEPYSHTARSPPLKINFYFQFPSQRALIVDAYMTAPQWSVAKTTLRPTKLMRQHE